ncbi:MAG: GNAT family N-acetyltransferase [Gammaproteobacteria bacterium]
MPITIKQPVTDTEFAQYYKLRWRILRAPWNEPQGSEKDELEDSSHHVIACNDDDIVIGVGRLQFNTDKEAQIRYMAVEPAYEGRGIGRQIVAALEAIAQKNNHPTIVLDAREPAVGFYERLGYKIKAKSYLLFNSIQHYRMTKTL